MKTKKGQNIFDIAVQEIGTASAAYDIASSNDMMVSDDPRVGFDLIIPGIEVEKKVRDAFKRKDIYPASGVNNEYEGIGYWAIEIDNIVQ